MIDSKTIEELLDLFVSQVHSAEAQWISIPKYFEKNRNELLRRYIIDCNKYAYSGRRGLQSKKCPLILEYSSYCLQTCGGVVIILAQKEDGSVTHRLFLQPDSYGRMTEIPCEGVINEKLETIIELISDEQYEAEKFVNKILHQAKEN